MKKSIKIVAKRRVLHTPEGREKIFEIISLEALTAEELPPLYVAGCPCVLLDSRGHLMIWNTDKFWDLALEDLINETTMVEVNKVIRQASQELRKVKYRLFRLQRKRQGRVIFVNGKRRGGKVDAY